MLQAAQMTADIGISRGDTIKSLTFLMSSLINQINDLLRTKFTCKSTSSLGRKATKKKTY